MKVLDEGRFGTWNGMLHAFEQEVSSAWYQLKQNYEALSGTPGFAKLETDTLRAISILEKLLVKTQNIRNV